MRQNLKCFGQICNKLTRRNLTQMQINVERLIGTKSCLVLHFFQQFTDIGLPKIFLYREVIAYLEDKICT
ncbi:uncharacterized protein Smp_200100 [Schistosoma mansoni]|uniref:uncharacterized protein n=1 Tax=Schistosoma mansoni TaxID=6183 RepID=UPI00022DC27A|nr:uncharacterized protein Smp_200100 [Schistosoma mansoni]|eukprot:XP_018649350.1 uncharacterized protein Smp_200100 [Schistosoma mansoni]